MLEWFFDMSSIREMARNEWQFPTIRDSNGGILIQAQEETAVACYRPREISGKILVKLKHMMEERVSDRVKEAVSMIPAYFKEAQRQAIFEVIRCASLRFYDFFQSLVLLLLPIGMKALMNL